MKSTTSFSLVTPAEPSRKATAMDRALRSIVTASSVRSIRCSSTPMEPYAETEFRLMIPNTWLGRGEPLDDGQVLLPMLQRLGQLTFVRERCRQLVQCDCEIVLP